MEKRYILTGKQLEELLARSACLSALNSGGVDNWSWYGESIGNFISNWVKENNKNPNEDWCIDDIAYENLKLYEELK